MNSAPPGVVTASPRVQTLGALPFVAYPNGSPSRECTVMLVCIDPMNKCRAFVNYALIVIILFNFLMINQDREKDFTAFIKST